MPIAFDSGGVTTGPVTVPFILALAGGMTSMIKQKKMKMTVLEWSVLLR